MVRSRRVDGMNCCKKDCKALEDSIGTNYASSGNDLLWYLVNSRVQRRVNLGTLLTSECTDVERSQAIPWGSISSAMVSSSGESRASAPEDNLGGQAGWLVDNYLCPYGGVYVDRLHVLDLAPHRV